MRLDTMNEPCRDGGDHIWATISGKTMCCWCGAIQFDGQSFAEMYLTYDLYLRGLVEDGDD